MKKYLNTIKLSIKDESLFKMDFLLGFIAIPIQLYIIYYFWKQGLGDNKINNFTLNTIILYFLFIQLLQISYTSAMYVTYELWNEINNGTIIVWLFRPIYYPLYTFSKKIGKFLLNITICLFIIIALFLLFNFKIAIINILFVFISALLGYIILFEIQYIIGSLTFWMENVITFRDVIIDILMLIGGLIIPLDFMPSIIQKISFLTPMPSIYYYPTKILTDNIVDINQFLNIIKAQLIWVLILGITIKILWKKGSYNIEQGS